MSGIQGSIWVRSEHQLFTEGLIRLLQDRHYRAQPHAQEAQLCLHALCLSSVFPLSRPELPTLALVGAGLPVETLAALLRGGYRGYLRPESDLPRLVQALEAVARGEMWAERSVLTQSLGPILPSRLTVREQEVLHYLRQGWSNAEVAGQLGITVKTVKTHVSAILTKVGARDRIELVVHDSGPRWWNGAPRSAVAGDLG